MIIKLHANDTQLWSSPRWLMKLMVVSCLWLSNFRILTTLLTEKRPEVPSIVKCLSKLSERMHVCWSIERANKPLSKLDVNDEEYDAHSEADAANGDVSNAEEVVLPSKEGCRGEYHPLAASELIHRIVVLNMQSIHSLRTSTTVEKKEDQKRIIYLNRNMLQPIG